jgi:hypothetical protein
VKLIRLDDESYFAAYSLTLETDNVSYILDQKRRTAFEETPEAEMQKGGLISERSRPFEGAVQEQVNYSRSLPP